MREENRKSLASVAGELAEEMKEFLRVRYYLMMSELRDKASAWKANVPFIAVGAIMLVTAWLLFTGAIVAAIFVAFVGNAFAWAIALLIVAIAYTVLGGVAVLFAYRGLTQAGVLPRRTMEVLQEDREWIRQEARSEA